MQSLTFTRTNGNVPKTLPGEDHISGLIAYPGTLPTGFTKDEPVQAVSSIETAEKLGITADASDWEIKVLHYQLSEIFRISPSIILYVGLFGKPENNQYDFAEVKKLQYYTGGKIRQMAVYAGDVALKDEHISALQGMATTLETEDMPVSILYAPMVQDLSALPKNLAGQNRRNVSVVIAQAGNGKGYELFDEKNPKNEEGVRTVTASVSSIGVVLGLVSIAGVHESIAWVAKYPCGVEIAAFGDGTLVRDLDRAVLKELDDARYLFFITYSGLNGTYMNDSHNMDEPVSDYAMIENVRTMDKAVRGIRTYLLPELGSALYINPETGKLQSYTVKHLENVANKPLEEMEKAGELSGFSVEVDPDQNVLSSSTIEFVIKKVGVGVMRKIKVNIGYTESI